MFNSIWYQNLVKPYLAPPNWIFAPIWTVLYILIFASLVFYIYTPIKNKELGYILFFIQILLNILWSPFFFGLKSILGALIILILLDVVLLFTIVQFFKVSKIAGIILIPYLIWILFATYLNIAYLILN